MAWGMAQILSNGQDLRYIPSELATVVGAGKLFAVPWLVIIAALVAAAGAIVLRMTRFGRYAFGVGSNPRRSRGGPDSERRDDRSSPEPAPPATARW